MLFAWAVKFNRKYVGPIYTKPNNRESASCSVYLRGGARTPKSKLNSFFSLSKKSERDLPASERENGWWVAYGSTPKLLHYFAINDIQAKIYSARLVFGFCFYRAMHFSAFARSWDRMSSVCLSVRLSVTFVICDHIGWKSWKLIAQTISPAPSLFVAKRRSTYSQGNMGKFWGD